MRYKEKSFLIILVLLSVFSLFGAACAQNINAYVDRSAPELNISGYSLEGNVLTMRGTAYDIYSGVSDISVSVDGKPHKTVDKFEEGYGGEWVYRYIVPENTSRYGSFNVLAVDQVGNASDITKKDIEIYNVDSKLIYPPAMYINTIAVPKKVGEPVRAVVTISGRGYDYIEFELKGPDFPLSWNGYFGEKEAPAGNYLATVRAYNKVGVYTVSNVQMIVGPKGNPTPAPQRYRDVDIFGYVEELSDKEVVVDGTVYIINDDSQIDPAIKPGDKVTGLGKYDIIDGTTTVVVLNRIEDKTYNLPDIEYDKKIGEEEFAGIVEAVGEDYIVVDGKVIIITDKTKLNVEFKDIRPGDFVSGVAEIFSISGRKAIFVNKALNDKMKTGKIAGHVVDMGDGWVLIDTNGMRFTVTSGTIINNGEYTIGDMILVEYLIPVNDALTITKLEKAPCTELPAYYYGEVFGIFEDTSEIVIEDLIHIIDPAVYYDLDIAELELHSFVAVVDLECNMRVLRVVQNAGETLPEDRIVGTVTRIGDKDINGNTPVFIDDKYMFISDHTDVYPELRKNMVAGVAKVGEEIISIHEIPDASINTDDLVDFVGLISRISSKDNHGNSYVTVNGITYKITENTVIDETIGSFEKGATVSGTVYENSLVHAAVIKEKAEYIDPNNTFTGKIEKGEIVGQNEYKVIINNAKYTIDENTMVYAMIEEKNTIIGVHDKGTFLALRDYPYRASTARPQVMFSKLEKVSAKTAEGEFTVTANGKEFTVSSAVFQKGYIATGINSALLYIEEEDGTDTLYGIVSDNAIDINDAAVPYTGKVGSIGLQDGNGIGIIYIDGFAYAYTPKSVMGVFNDGDNIIFAVNGYEIVFAVKLDNDKIYASPKVFSDEISSISDMQTDGSYIVTLASGEQISLTEDTLLNDNNAPIEPGIVISGLRFGNYTYIAATYGTGNIDVRDAAFSGILEDAAVSPDGVVEKVTVNHRDYYSNFRPENIDDYIPGKIIAGSVRPGKNAVSMTIILPEVLEGEIISVGGYVEKIENSDQSNERKIVVGEDVYSIPETASVKGNLVDEARVSFFAMNNTNKIVSLSVVESWDQGAPVDGKIEAITSEHISNPAHKEDWKHFSRAGIHDLMSDDSVELNGTVDVKDTVHGFLFGEEREVLAVVKENNSLFAKIGKLPTALKAGLGSLAAILVGAGAAIGIGSRMINFSGTLEMISDNKARITDPTNPSATKVVKLDSKTQQMASSMNYRKVKGYTQFGKVTKIDIDEA